MAFCARAFCLEPVAPSLSELLLWLRQQGTPVVVAGGASAADLLAPTWREVLLSYDGGEEPLAVGCHALGDPDGAARLRAEVSDFLDDLAELPPSPARAHVIDHLRAAQLVLVVAFPAGGASAAGYQTNGRLLQLFVQRAGGIVQCDGLGFFDEDDEIIVRLG